MRSSRPLRWIEEAEARQALAIALYEAAPEPGASTDAPVPRNWIERLRRRLFARTPHRIGERGAGQ